MNSFRLKVGWLLVALVPLAFFQLLSRTGSRFLSFASFRSLVVHLVVLLLVMVSVLLVLVAVSMSVAVSVAPVAVPIAVSIIVMAPMVAVVFHVILCMGRMVRLQARLVGVDLCAEALLVSDIFDNSLATVLVVDGVLAVSIAIAIARLFA